MPGYSGQGIVKLAKRQANGLPAAFRDIGNCSEFEVGLEQDTVERAESRTGNRLPLRRLTRSQSGTLKIKGDEFNRENFALATLGVATSVIAGSAVTGYVLPTGLVVGDYFRLPAKNVSVVSIVDSTGSPKTLTLGTNYSIDLGSGMGRILDITAGGAFVQPFKGNYTPGAYDVIGAFKDAAAEYFVQLDGVNTDDNNRRGICEVFRVRLSPTQALALINNDYLDWDLSGSVLADLTRDASSPEGQFFSFVPLA